MPENTESSLRETLLRSISESGSDPWYARKYADKNGLDIEQLYSPLNDLRLADLIKLTEWIAGSGQGYVITDRGRDVLADPVFLAHLQKGISRTAPLIAEKVESQAPSSGSTGYAVTTLERGDAARDVVYGINSTPMVYALLAANILGFFISLVFAVRDSVPFMRFLEVGDVGVLAKAGAASMPDLVRGDWYRLLACCFLHYGLLHVTLNMTSLYLARRVEHAFGSGRFLILYLSCGICGSVSAMLFSPGTPETPVYLAGASGALWGMMTSNLCWLFINRTHFAPSEVQKWISSATYTLLLNIGVSMLPNVSMAAHFGGGLVGIIATPLLQIHRFGTPGRRFSAGVLLAMLPTMFLGTLAMALEKDSRHKAFVDFEKMKSELGQRNK